MGFGKDVLREVRMLLLAPMLAHFEELKTA